MSGQTVQTQIRLLLAVWSETTLFAMICRPRSDWSGQGLHYLPCRLYRLDSLLYGRSHIVQIFWVSEYLGNLRQPNTREAKAKEKGTEQNFSEPIHNAVIMVSKVTCPIMKPYKGATLKLEEKYKVYKGFDIIR